MPTLLAKASSEALAVALEISHESETTMPHLVSRAHGSAMGVAGQLDSAALDEELQALLGAAADAAVAAVASTSASDAPAEAEEEEEEEEEEDAGFGGLGDLFG